MSTLNAPDTISGKEGRAVAVINGNNEDLFFLKNIEANLEKLKSQIKAVGKRMVGHKTTGLEGTGSATMYYMTPLFRELLDQYKKTGQDLYFNIVIENSDPASAAGTQSILLIGCNTDGGVLAKLDGDSDDPLEEDIDFTFEDYDTLKPFNKI